MYKISSGSLVRHGVRTLGFELRGGEKGLHRLLVSASVIVCGKENISSYAASPEGTVLILTSVDQMNRNNIFCSIFSVAESKKTPLIVYAQETVPHYFIALADQNAIPLVNAAMDPVYLKSRILFFLRGKIDHSAELHGTLLEVFGMGVFITGRSGIGKTECGLELLVRGHKLIADDLVEFTEERNGLIKGRCPDSIKCLMGVRGIGIVNINTLFGQNSVINETRLGLVAELKDCPDDSSTCAEKYRIFDTSVPLYSICARPRKNGDRVMCIERAVKLELERSTYN
ncbi:MAG: hypothetical protein M0P57_08470 [Syntrophales bacterium]|jgi:HPr kinase/phosphorylase|nr:hypothetical protein [Syntrophales bacterium]MDY0043284.1 hypothetical protein [Syntrophales bacterium]